MENIERIISFVVVFSMQFMQLAVYLFVFVGKLKFLS